MVHLASFASLCKHWLGALCEVDTLYLQRHLLTAFQHFLIFCGPKSETLLISTEIRKNSLHTCSTFTCGSKMMWKLSNMLFCFCFFPGDQWTPLQGPESIGAERGDESHLHVSSTVSQRRGRRSLLRLLLSNSQSIQHQSCEDKPRLLPSLPSSNSRSADSPHLATCYLFIAACCSGGRQ